MPLSVSNTCKANAVSHAGNIPCMKIIAYDCYGTTGRGGLSRTIVDGGLTGAQIFPIIGSGLQDICPIMSFHWGESLPLGISKFMVTDELTWTIRWGGYFLCKRPQNAVGNITYQFAYVGTGFVVLNLDNSVIASTSSPNKLKLCGSVTKSIEEWIQISVFFSRMGTTARRIQSERFTLFWKDDIDNEWRILGADVTAPSLSSFKNITGTPVDDITDTDDYALNATYLLTLHKVGIAYHFHIDDSVTEYAVTPDALQTYNLNPSVGHGDIVNISWGPVISHLDQVQIFTTGFDQGYELPAVNDVQLEVSSNAASVLSFSVPITQSTFDLPDIDRTNAYTYNQATESFGILRKGMLVEYEAGYIVNSTPSLVRRFTGFIQDIHPNHSSTEATLQVTCLDPRVLATEAGISKIENMVMSPAPDELSYDIIQRFPESTGIGPDGRIRPPCYDRWNIASVVRERLYQCGFTSSQLWAKRSYITEVGDSTTQFDISNPVGTTFRYTYDATGTNPHITGSYPETLDTIHISGQTFADDNNGDFIVTGSGTNYFEVTNALGTVESNKTIGTGTITIERVGDYLIEDRAFYLDSSQAYPYAIMNQYGTKTESKSIEVNPTDPYRLSDLTKQRSTTQQVAIAKETKRYFGFIYVDPPTQKKTVWTSYSSTVESAYLYQFAFDDDPWERLQSLVSDFGLRLGINADGNVYLTYPNNPQIYNTHTEDTDTINYVEYLHVTGGAIWDKQLIDPATDTNASQMAPVRCFAHTSKADSFSYAHVHFRGVGLKLIVPRPRVNSFAFLSVDGIWLDGVNELDAVTHDKGHDEWLDLCDVSGVANLSSGTLNIGGVDVWYYSNGVLPTTGTNPAVLTICNNLTYGDHVVNLYSDDGLFYLEGFMVLENAIDVPVHTFDSSVDIVDMDYQDSLDGMLNDITVIGNQTGAENDYISARATDLYSITDPTAPNYIGRRKSATIISPKVTQSTAEYLAQHILMTYRRGQRSPNVNTVGLPWLWSDDCVGILDTKLGMYSTSYTSDWHSSLYFLRYWINNIRESFTVDSEGAPKYEMSVAVTSYQPLPAYELLPEPSVSDFAEPLVLSITVDGINPSYNPYEADHSGQYVNLDIGIFWHCRSLTVRIVAAEYLWQQGALMFPSKAINVLYAKTGFIPADRYICRFDGWLVNQDGTGAYAPDGDYAVEVEMHKYDTGEVFYYRSDSALPNVLLSGSKTVITVDQDNTIYPSPLYTAVNDPVGTNMAHARVYNDTNTGLGVEIAIHLELPAKVWIRGTVRHFFVVGDAPIPIVSGVFIPQEKWDIQVPSEADAPLLDAGDYTFYMKPVEMWTKDGSVVPFKGIPQGNWTADVLNGSESLGNGDWWVAWHCDYEVRFMDKGGHWTTAGTNYICWGGPSASVYGVGDIQNSSDDSYSYTFYRIKNV